MSRSRSGQSVRKDVILEESYEGTRTRCSYTKCKKTIKHGQTHVAVYQIVSLESGKGLRLGARYCGHPCRTANLDRIADLRAGIQDED